MLFSKLLEILDINGIENGALNDNIVSNHIETSSKMSRTMSKEEVDFINNLNHPANDCICYLSIGNVRSQMMYLRDISISCMIFSYSDLFSCLCHDIIILKFKRILNPKIEHLSSNFSEFEREC